MARVGELGMSDAGYAAVITAWLVRPDSWAIRKCPFLQRMEVTVKEHMVVVLNSDSNSAGCAHM